MMMKTVTLTIHTIFSVASNREILT